MKLVATVKELMVAIISVILGATSTAVFVGWTVAEMKVAFWVSLIMLVFVMAGGLANGGRKVVKKRSPAPKRRKSRKGKRAARAP